MDFILEAGDVFYLPRGWWHDPLPLGEETFHLALGTFPAYTMDYLGWVMQQMQGFLPARQSMSDWEQDKDRLSVVAAQLQTILGSQENYRRFTDEFIAATRVESPLAIDLFGNPVQDLVSDDIGLRISANRPHGLSDGYVIGNGSKVNLDQQSLRLIELVVAQPGIRVGKVIATLLDIDSHRLRKLVTDLCRHDVLQVQRDRAAVSSYV